MWGRACPPVSMMLVEKIHKWECVDMAELLTEYWGMVHCSKAETELTQGNRQPTAKKKVTDVMIWVQYFADHTSVMMSRNPGTVPELLAYPGLSMTQHSANQLLLQGTASGHR